MGTIAAILGGIGGLCAILGIITAIEVLPPMGDQYTWMFWFFLSVILLVSSVALSGGRGNVD